MTFRPLSRKQTNFGTIEWNYIPELPEGAASGP